MQMIKIDHHPGDNDHVAFMFRPQRHPSFEPPCALSRIICEGGWTPPKFLERDLYRGNWDHTFSPTLLNTLNFGILHWYLADEAINAPFADELPQLPGVEHKVPSEITFSDGFYGFGGDIGERRR